MPWAARTIVAPVGGVEFYLYPPHATGIAVGPAPQWGDDSDETYAEFAGEWGGASVADFAQAAASIGTRPESVPVTDTVRIAVWYRGVNDVPPEVSIADALSTGYRAHAVPGESGGLTAPLGWTVVEVLPSLAGDTMIGLLNLWQDDDLVVEFQTNFNGPWPAELTMQHHLIYEARVAVYHKVGSYAPPGRLYPADTIGSVGGPVRQFPPSKSRQRSSRGVGYY